MNSTKDITAASDITNQISSSGLSLDKLISASVTAFNSNLYEHATPQAFIKTMISHANRSAGIRLADNLTIFGHQYNIPRDIADTLPACLLPLGPNTKPNRNLPDWFNTPSCKAALRKVNGPRNVWSNPDEATSAGEAMPSHPELTSPSEEGVTVPQSTFTQRPGPPSAEEREDLRARTDEAFLLYGADLPLIDGNSQLRGLLSARRGESEITIASRILTLDPPIVRLVGALLRKHWVEPDDEVQLENAFLLWRTSLVPTALYFLMTASHYMRELPPSVPGVAAPPPKVQMSLRDAQAKVWRLNFVRALQR